MRRITFTSESAERCQLIFGKAFAGRLPESLKIVDSGFRKVFGERLEDEYLMPGGEHVKSVDRVFEIYQVIRASRRKAITAVGGGSLIDLVGYASSGHTDIEKLFLFPTTTVSQVMPALKGFRVNFEFVKDLLSFNCLPDKIFIDFEVSYREYACSSKSVLIFPLLVALSFDNRLFKYLFNVVVSGKDISAEQWEDIVFPSVKAYLKGIETGRFVVGMEIGRLIETASRLKAGYDYSLLFGAMMELRLAEEFGTGDSSVTEDFFKVVKLLWDSRWSSRIDMSSLVDLVKQKGGVRISTPDGNLDKTYFVGCSVFERFVREKTWRGLENFV